MPFGFTGAPSIFMRLMNIVLKPLINRCVVIYLDDILAFNNSSGEYIEHLRIGYTLKRRLYVNLEKYSFFQEDMKYLGFLISRDGMNMDTNKIRAILEWMVLRNSTERNFELLNKKVTNAPVLTLLHFNKVFVVECDALGVGIRKVLSQEGRLVAYFSEKLNEARQIYSTYDMEFYAMVMKEEDAWKTIIHTDHQPLYLQTQTKLQQERHFRWKGFLQKFHLVIKYKKGITNKVVDMLSRPPMTKIAAMNTIMQLVPFAHEVYKEEYMRDVDFGEVYQQLHDNPNVDSKDTIDYHLKYGLLYKIGKLCIPQEGKIQLIREAHLSNIVGHFGVGKIVANLQRYVYWPKMQEQVSKFIRGCVLCSTSKPSNRKLGLYMPLSVPNRPWESISMDFVGGLSMSRHDHDYLFVVVDHFSKMCILMPCKKSIKGHESVELFFSNVWVHFGFPNSIILERDSRFLGRFWTTLWEKIYTKLKRSTAFHSQTNG
eukprot:Gb_12464 [translate_table: standard]